VVTHLSELLYFPVVWPSIIGMEGKRKKKKKKKQSQNEAKNRKFEAFHLE